MLPNEFYQQWIYFSSESGAPEAKSFAYQIMGIGYIPWSPYGGKHIMDNFGNLIQALPQHYFNSEK